MTDFHAGTRALITGGTQGLGFAIAQELVAQGCRRVVVTGRNPHRGAKAADALRETGAEAYYLQVDMSDADAAIYMVDSAGEHMEGVTSLVNCAAMTDRGSILDTTPALWDQILNTNTKGPFFALQRFAQRCIDERIPGTCVNILSIVVHCGLPFLAPYSASKAALLNITKNSAAALSKHRIRVNAINVGWMDTPGEDVIQQKYHDRPEGWLADVEASMPFGMLVKPEHVARQTAFFLGPQSGVVTGSVMDFDQQVAGAYPDTNDV
ncbi:SDR family oxidoreductase [Pseudoruegeria sp. HB172150]|uniref:SDR family oxidoreductase n=1 Tax=Pseudoruegeria sp. HB172150 TaxID=2721164 RepID=UPI001552C352|nr:SDR family oxidoreductase [Pseudoruegeria sp. HB172150]